MPVAAKMAFSTAGAATAIVGSPTPPQKPPEAMTIVLEHQFLQMRHRFAHRHQGGCRVVKGRELVEHQAMIDRELARSRSPEVRQVSAQIN